MPDATQGPGLSELLARFVAEQHAGDAFDDALRAARVCLADARAALQTPIAASELASHALARYGAPLRRAFAAGARLAGEAGGRTDAAIVAAALSSGELAGRSDADVAEAIAIGRAVATRLDRALSLDAPWDAAAVISGIGATAAAARVLGLDAESARNALGIAATQATGLGVTEDTPSAALASGKAAADAMEAALLAQNGFTAAAASVEGRRGLAALMASHFDQGAVSDGLGVRWISA